MEINKILINVPYYNIQILLLLFTFNFKSPIPIYLYKIQNMFKKGSSFIFIDYKVRYE